MVRSFRPGVLAAGWLAALSALADPGPSPLASPAVSAVPVLEARPRRAAGIKDVLALADRQSPDLASARAQAAAVEAQTRKVFAAVLPEISIGGQYVHTTVAQQLDLGPIIGLVGGVYGIPPMNPGLIPDPVELAARNSLYANVQLMQVLFTPMMFAIPAAFDGRDAARLGAREAREQVLLNVARIYYGAQGLDGLVQAARDAVVVALRREKDAQAKLEVGTGTHVDALRAMAEVAQARNQLTMLEAQRESLLALLEALVGEAVRPLASGEESLALGPAGEEAQAPWTATYAVQAARKAVSTQESLVLADSLGWLPTLAGIGKGNYNSNKGFTGQNFTADFIVALNWTLYDRGTRYVSLNENRAKLADAQAKLDGATAKARATWLTAKTNLKAAQAQLEQSEAQLEVATRAQREIDNAVKQGVATGLEQSDIDSKRFFAASAAAQARSQIQVRQLELVAAEGRLAQALGFPDPAP